MGTLSRQFNQSRAFKRFGGKIGNAGFELFRKLIAPTAKGVRPRFDRVLVNTDLVKRTDSAPAIVIDKRHPGFMPARFTNETPLQSGRNDVMTVFQNVRFDREIVPSNP